MTALNELLQRGKPHRKQLNMIDIFNVVDTLRQRGFDGITESQVSKTLLSGEDLEAKLDFIKQFNDKKFRARVRNIVFGYGNEATDHPAWPTIRPSKENQSRFGKTVELLFAFLCVQELSAFSASFGVHIKNAPCGGDYDCIVNFQNSLFHFECKSGDAKNVSTEQLQHFLFRHDFLTPEASVLFFDYDRIGDDVIKKFLGLNLSSEPLGSEGRITRILKLEIGARKVYMVYPGIVAVDISKDGNILANLRAAMRFLHRYKAYNQSSMCHLVEPKYLGLEGEILT